MVSVVLGWLGCGLSLIRKTVQLLVNGVVGFWGEGGVGWEVRLAGPVRVGWAVELR